ncbi:MAG: D-alanyl-D-alanine carboxypeptidase [Paracoccaceae bacterium]
MAAAQPTAAFVMDMRTGEVLHARNADLRVHPASLTKMMTLYLAFTELEAGRITLDQQVTVSAHVQAQPPSELGLRRGQRVSVRTLIRGAAVRSANDAATALGELISGSEAAFAVRMTETARAMGMNNTTFRNANGLTAQGHLSTAREMTLLGQRLFRDFPQYFNLFSRISTDTEMGTIYNTNRRFLNAYRGADGLKTGYTSAAGYNLTSTAQRGQERIIATYLGGTSVNQRNEEMARLLDLGFNRAPSRANIVRLATLRLPPPSQAETVTATRANPAERPNRGEALVRTAIRPLHRTPLTVRVADISIPASVIAAEQDAISAALVAAEAALPVEVGDSGDDDIVIAAIRPERRPALDTSLPEIAAAEIVAQADQPRAEQARVVVASAANGSWSVQLGAFSSRNLAERHLIQTALAEMESLNGATRDISSTIVGGRTMFRARFVGMSSDAANRACARLVALSQECLVIAPQI